MRGKPDIELGRKVIRAEAGALLEMAEALGEEFNEAVAMISECAGKVVITGVGKSGLVGGKIAASLSSLGTPALFLQSDEAVHGDSGVLSGTDVVIAISHSGETSEVRAVIPLIKQAGCKMISITGSGENSLARAADVALKTYVRAEADPRGLAPTTSTTATMALGDALALCVAEVKGFTREDFRRFHPGGALGAMLSGASPLRPR